jgi:hypothetical protein
MKMGFAKQTLNKFRKIPKNFKTNLKLFVSLSHLFPTLLFNIENVYLYCKMWVLYQNTCFLPNFFFEKKQFKKIFPF